jgi:hypothetical protein
VAGAQNDIMVTLRTNFDLVGTTATPATVTITGLSGSATPDAAKCVRLHVASLLRVIRSKNGVSDSRCVLDVVCVCVCVFVCVLVHVFRAT